MGFVEGTWVVLLSTGSNLFALGATINEQEINFLVIKYWESLYYIDPSFVTIGEDFVWDKTFYHG